MHKNKKSAHPAVPDVALGRRLEPVEGYERQSLKPHIVYILTKLELGGAQKVCLSLLEGVGTHSFSSSLITGTDGPLVSRAQKHRSVFFLASMKREVGLKNVFSEIKAFFSIIRILRKLKKKHKHIIVHTHSTKAGILGRWAAFFAGIKKRVHTVHGFGFHEHQSKFSWLTHFFLEWCMSFITTQYVCVSQTDIETGKRLLPRFEKKHILIRAAVDWDEFFVPVKKAGWPRSFDTIPAESLRMSGQREDECSFKSPIILSVRHSRKATANVSKEIGSIFTFGTVSCFKPQKNLQDLCKAFKIMHNTLPDTLKNHVMLEVIGDGVLRPQLESWIEENNMQRNIHLLGWQKNVAPFMHRWDAFVMSSLWEGLPCAIIEARLSKLPVLAYNVGGISEVIHHAKNGFLVNPGEYEKLAEHMGMVVQSENLYKNIANFPDQLNLFHIKSMVKEHAGLYQVL